MNMNTVKSFSMDMNMKWSNWLVNEEIKLEANKCKHSESRPMGWD